MSDSDLRELLAEALDELKAHLIISQPERVGAWGSVVKAWCKYCHRFGGHTDDCLITRIERELEVHA